MMGVRVHEQAFETKCDTADNQIKMWAFHFRETEKRLSTTEITEFVELVKGDETAYGVISLLIGGVTALTPETAFEVDYLRSTADDEKENDNDVDKIIQKCSRSPSSRVMTSGGRF